MNESRHTRLSTLRALLITRLLVVLLVAGTMVLWDRHVEAGEVGFVLWFLGLAIGVTVIPSLRWTKELSPALGFLVRVAFLALWLLLFWLLIEGPSI